MDLPRTKFLRIADECAESRFQERERTPEVRSPGSGLAALLQCEMGTAPEQGGPPEEVQAMWLRHSQWPMCGALLAALVFEAEAVRAGDDLLQGQEGKAKEGLGRSTSTLELVMPANERSTPSSAPSRPAPQAASTPRPVAHAPIANSQGRAAPGLDAPSSGEVRIPVRLDSRALLGRNDLFLDLRRGVIEQKEPLVGENAPRASRLDFTGPEPEPGSAREPGKPPGPAPGARSGWLGEHLDLDLNDGISYRTNVEWQDMNVRFKMWGPIVKGHPGVGARVRGLQLGEHPVEVRARATTRLQDVQVRIDF